MSLDRCGFYRVCNVPRQVIIQTGHYTGCVMFPDRLLYRVCGVLRQARQSYTGCVVPLDRPGRGYTGCVVSLDRPGRGYTGCVVSLDRPGRGYTGYVVSLDRPDGGYKGVCELKELELLLADRERVEPRVDSWSSSRQASWEAEATSLALSPKAVVSTSKFSSCSCCRSCRVRHLPVSSLLRAALSSSI